MQELLERVGEVMAGRERLSSLIIRDIRRAIFELHTPQPAGLRAKIAATVAEAGVTLGFRPDLAVDGPLEYAVPDELRGDLIAVLREALSNVA